MDQHYVSEGMKMEKDGVRSGSRVVGVPQRTWSKSDCFLFFVVFTY